MEQRQKTILVPRSRYSVADRHVMVAMIERRGLSLPRCLDKPFRYWTSDLQWRKVDCGDEDVVTAMRHLTTELCSDAVDHYRLSARAHSGFRCSPMEIALHERLDFRGGPSRARSATVQNDGIDTVRRSYSGPTFHGIVGRWQSPHYLVACSA